MTDTEILSALAARAPEQRTRRWLRSEIAHEEHQGIYTYHPCRCGEWTRSGRCAGCLREMLAYLEREE